MNKEELEELEHESPKSSRVIYLDYLKNTTNRTLLWGYTCDRDSWHVYLESGVFVVHCYSHPVNTIFSNEYTELDLDIVEVVPDKRLYPEVCDFEFCRLLKQFGIYLPFTTFDPVREKRQYHGEL